MIHDFDNHEALSVSLGLDVPLLSGQLDSAAFEEIGRLLDG
ncbi:hypothetical protein OG455_04305 [Kitasatospora sp. NBC_01287]|nr:hypothetical protein [Kitasatospora sp. NBC_01287]MCX4744748.1 hypothetical protein [Kitasatospora sp. NBC_01287]